MSRHLKGKNCPRVGAKDRPRHRPTHVPGLLPRGSNGGNGPESINLFFSLSLRTLITSVISILIRAADIVAMYPSSGDVRPGYVRQGLPMGKASGWAIVGGCFLMVIGLALVPAAFGPHPDDSILGLGICIFSFGAFAGAGGLYMKARAVQAAPAAPKPQPK